MSPFDSVRYPRSGIERPTGWSTQSSLSIIEDAICLSHIGGHNRKEKVCVNPFFQRYWQVCFRSTTAQYANSSARLPSLYDSLDDSDSLGLENAAIERLPSGNRVQHGGAFPPRVQMDERSNAPEIGATSLRRLLSFVGMVPLAWLQQETTRPAFLRASPLR